jgi:hypothetical protein
MSIGDVGLGTQGDIMEYPRVGVGVIVQRGPHILLGRRCVSPNKGIRQLYSLQPVHAALVNVLQSGAVHRHASGGCMFQGMMLLLPLA